MAPFVFLVNPEWRQVLRSLVLIALVLAAGCLETTSGPDGAPDPDSADAMSWLDREPVTFEDCHGARFVVPADAASVLPHVPDGYEPFQGPDGLIDVDLHGYFCASVRVGNQTNHDVGIAWTESHIVPPNRSPQDVQSDAYRFETFIDPRATALVEWYAAYGVDYRTANITANTSGINVVAPNLRYAVAVPAPTNMHLIQASTWERTHSVIPGQPATMIDTLVGWSRATPFFGGVPQQGAFAGGLMGNLTQAGRNGDLMGDADSMTFGGKSWLSKSTDAPAPHPAVEGVRSTDGWLFADMQDCQGRVGFFEATVESLAPLLTDGYEPASSPWVLGDTATQLQATVDDGPTGRVHIKAHQCATVVVDDVEHYNVSVAWTGVLLSAAAGAEANPGSVIDEYLFELFLDPTQAPQLAALLGQHGLPFVEAAIHVGDRRQPVEILIEDEAIYQLPGLNAPGRTSCQDDYRAHVNMDAQPFWIDQNGYQCFDSVPEPSEIAIQGGMLANLEWPVGSDAGPAGGVAGAWADMDWFPWGPATAELQAEQRNSGATRHGGP